MAAYFDIKYDKSKTYLNEDFTCWVYSTNFSLFTGVQQIIRDVKYRSGLLFTIIYAKIHFNNKVRLY